MHGRWEENRLHSCRIGAEFLEGVEQILDGLHRAIALPVPTHYGFAEHALHGDPDRAELLPRISAPGTKLFLDTQKLVILGQPLRAARRARLDFARAQADNEVCDERIFRLAGPVRHHHAPAGKLRHRRSLDGLRDGADLVHLEKQGVAGLHVQGLLHALRVCHQKVVSDDLAGVADVGLKLRVGLPIVLVKGVLDGDKRILRQPILIVRNQLVGGFLHRVRAGRVLEIQIILLGVRIVELRGGHVCADLDLPLMAGFLDGIHEHVKSLVVVLDAGSEASLISDVASILTIPLFDHALEGVVDLGTNDHSLFEGGGTHGEDHELLASKPVAGVAATVDHVEGGHGHDELVRRLS
mmetsp:Transcript_62194/g.133730  ORF Transcript_62194/g.133730 Transcript_62194/m.133730 type:complete len:354 (+) Transcript_62194:722-1783(+)